ncbi:MAG TPA: type I polyketide synthase, partial [Thermoanaerobaculia bacterium]|nr:type I polyketide synthase [Thermoanaerobaculia bacterium]
MAPTYDETDIAIIGMAGRFPEADDVNELWRNLCAGLDAVRSMSDEELLAAGVDPAQIHHPNLVKKLAMPRGIDRFDATFFGFSHREAEVMDPQQRLLLECAWQALEDAGYGGDHQPGPTAVYAGVSTSTYLLYHVLANPAVVATLDPLHLEVGNSGDYLTTRISHKLNLNGPSYLIQSACSTGLVAVHAACQSLLAEECDMALAGSVSINVSQLRGYMYEEGGIVSPDGCCRTFDAQARGSVVGGGLGLVVLRRLADAVADGDTIRAVIKGSAVNNDGGLKVGYTAPSVEGQARVIAEAMARSGVEARDIAYVEAHGTGTALGDPIEIEALTRAFNTNGHRQFCALGSLKTNIGHLATAAGIAGLIKTVLVVENGLIPPNLHFDEPNPDINFAESPFYVNLELKPWPQNGLPRRAGVSAFGFGGTNAHAVVEEAPAVPPSSVSPRPYQLLLLAAKSAAALDSATANLGAHLKEHPELNLADVSYTLARGRKAFSYRRVLASRDREEAIRLLADPSSEGVFTGYREAADPGVAFLFPGLGDQHLYMAEGLYAAEPYFRAEVDRGCTLLSRLLGVDLREILYPARQTGQENGSAAPGIDLRRLLGRGTEANDEASRQLDRTLYAQPALFVIEHALARLWMDWGVKPRAMIGYSLGEYTAACIAGVCHFEEALFLVAERAKLIEELPAGAMLAAALPESEIRPLLGPELAIAAVNAPQMCVVAGAASAVAELERELAQKGIASRLLRTTHAFHSPHMEPVAERLVEAARRLTLRAPRIPYISNVTGTWVTSREATDPEYWGRHLCQAVQFAAGVGELLKDSHFLLEVGPGQALSTFARQHPAATAATAVPCLGERGGAADQ